MPYQSLPLHCCYILVKISVALRDFFCFASNFHTLLWLFHLIAVSKSASFCFKIFIYEFGKINVIRSRSTSPILIHVSVSIYANEKKQEHGSQKHYKILVFLSVFCLLVAATICESKQSSSTLEIMIFIVLLIGYIYILFFFCEE